MNLISSLKNLFNRPGASAPSEQTQLSTAIDKASRGLGGHQTIKQDSSQRKTVANPFQAVGQFFSRLWSRLAHHEEASEAGPNAPSSAGPSADLAIPTEAASPTPKTLLEQLKTIRQKIPNPADRSYHPTAVKSAYQEFEQHIQPLLKQFAEGQALNAKPHYERHLQTLKGLPAEATNLNWTREQVLKEAETLLAQMVAKSIIAAPSLPSPEKMESSTPQALLEGIKKIRRDVQANPSDEGTVQEAYQDFANTIQKPLQAFLAKADSNTGPLTYKRSFEGKLKELQELAPESPDRKLAQEEVLMRAEWLLNEMVQKAGPKASGVGSSQSDSTGSSSSTA